MYIQIKETGEILPKKRTDTFYKVNDRKGDFKKLFDEVIVQ